MSAPDFSAVTGGFDGHTLIVAVLGVCAVAVMPRVVAYGASMVLAVIDWHNVEKDWYYIFTGARRDIDAVAAPSGPDEYGDDYVPESYLKNHEAWRDISRFVTKSNQQPDEVRPDVVATQEAMEYGVEYRGEDDFDRFDPSEPAHGNPDWGHIKEAANEGRGDLVLVHNARDFEDETGHDYGTQEPGVERGEFDGYEPFDGGSSRL